MIEKLQNELRSIELLAAQRQAYNSAKVIRNFRVAGDTLFPIIGSLLITLIPEQKAIVGLIVLLWFTVQCLFLNPKEKAYKSDGANIQEMFDIYVFQIPRSKLSKEVSPEIIYRYLTKYLKRYKKFINLENWYSISEDADKNKQILLCQRQNITWSTDQISKSQSFLSIIAFALLVISIINGYLNKARVTDWVIMLFVLIPLIKYIIQTHIAISENAKYLEKSKSEIADGLKMPIDTLFVRDIQNLIYQFRLTSVLVPEWFYWFHRDRNEKEAKNAIKTL